MPKVEATQGPIHRVPCPHCQGVMDFRELADQESGGLGWGNQLEKNATIDCDHCGKKSRISDIQKITVIKLAPL